MGIFVFQELFTDRYVYIGELYTLEHGLGVCDIALYLNDRSTETKHSQTVG